jgi:DNA-binding NtrC family response regulator
VAKQQPQAADDGHHSAAPRVLVVDDEPLVRSFVAEALFDSYEVVEAGSADEAMVHLSGRGTFHLVISDVSMPGSTDGFGLARWLREHHPATPILLITGYHRHAPADGELPPILHKPFTCDHLLGHVTAMLQGRRRPDVSRAGQRRYA